MIAAASENIINASIIFWLLFLLTSLVIGRLACAFICPFSILNIAGMKIKDALRIPSLRLNADSSKCVNCKKCEKECPMSLKVSDMVKAGPMSKSECILCGKCVDICPKKVIRYDLRSASSLKIQKHDVEQ